MEKREPLREKPTFTREFVYRQKKTPENLRTKGGVPKNSGVKDEKIYTYLFSKIIKEVKLFSLEIDSSASERLGSVHPEMR